MCVTGPPWSVRLTEVVVHPEFAIGTFIAEGHDLAVARLSEPIDDVAPIHLSEQDIVCATLPIQTVYYDAASTPCVYFDAEGQSCGFSEASASMDQRAQCVYVDSTGKECGQRSATCTSAGCHC